MLTKHLKTDIQTQVHCPDEGQPSGAPHIARGRPASGGVKSSGFQIGGFHLVWRIREEMHRQNFRSVLALHQAVESIDPGCITYTQLAAFVQNLPIRLSVRTLAAVCLVLNCRIDALLGFERPQP